jgi:aminoglycoside phosphotransferase (APT) family kinase protein
MSMPGGEPPAGRADTTELRAALEQALARRPAGAARIHRLDRRPLMRPSSFAIEDLDVVLDNGTCLQLVFKDLSPAAMPETTRHAKPAFLYDPRREIEVYRQVLPVMDLGTAACYGAVADERAGRYWLFLERATGRELFQVGEFAAWEEAARWLARLHDRASGDAERFAATARLIRYDGDHYRLWMRRACAMLGPSSGGQRARDRLARLAGRYEEVVGRLAPLPATVIHGEYYASNVLVSPAASGWAVCPVDWETAALGPGLLDLAALVAGKWTLAQREALTRAYRGALPPGSPVAVLPESFAAALDCCRLHLAVQWLGWSAGWSPPPDHRHDWLGEALALADRLGL